MTRCRFLNYLCRNEQTVSCLPSKQFDEFYRLYRSLPNRYLSTVVGGQCVANKHAKVPFARTFRYFHLDSIAIRWSWGYILYSQSCITCIQNIHFSLECCLRHRNENQGHPRHRSYLSIMLYSRTAASRLLRCARRWQHSSAQPPLNPITLEDIAHFAQFLPQNAILSTLPPISVPPSEIDQYNTDWLGKYSGTSTTVLRPQTTEQVSRIMKWCHERKIGVVPQGGNTGLVGGSVPLKDELILSLNNMANVRSFDPVSGAS